MLQVDGYQAYKTLVTRRGKSNIAPVRLAFCLAHARRKFVDVVKLTGSSEALSILARIAEIYRIEADLRGQNAYTRLIVRRHETAPIMGELKAKLTELRDEVSSKSALGKAVSYTLNHWDGLAVFLKDGRVEVDSNVVERSMKSVALTRKNSLFVGSARGGETFAVLASLVSQPNPTTFQRVGLHTPADHKFPRLGAIHFKPKICSKNFPSSLSRFSNICCIGLVAN